MREKRSGQVSLNFKIVDHVKTAVKLHISTEVTQKENFG